MSCKFCGKSWVSGCWDEAESWTCGNNDGSVLPKRTPPAPIPLPKVLQRQIDAASAKLSGLLAKAREYRAAHTPR